MKLFGTIGGHVSKHRVLTMAVVALGMIAVIRSEQWNTFDGKKIPIPFVTSKEDGFGASLLQIGQIGSGGTIPVYSVELSDASASDTFQHLNEDAVYLLRTSNGAESVPFDLAFDAINGREPDFFLYKYSDINATQEIANRNAATFVERFPARFGASNRAWLNEQAHNDALTTFEETHGIAFETTAPTVETSFILFEPNALYALVVNEPGGAEINFHAPAVCGDDWMMNAEECDDGNMDDGDGCSALCTIESGYACTDNPSVCVPQILCGNGTVDAGEQCDQGINNGTGICTTICTFDVPHPFGSSSASAMSSSQASSLSGTTVEIDYFEDTLFVMHADKIPNFTYDPTKVAIRSGDWSDPSIWSSSTVPVAGEIVRIEASVTVAYDIESDIALKALGVKGDLLFKNDRNTRLKVGTLQVYPQGYLEVGTETNPIPEGRLAEIIIADQPLETGTVEQPGLDPVQWGTALIGYGKVRMHGNAIPTTWVRLAEEAFSGTNVFVTEEPMTDWRPGQTVIVPDTRQPLASWSGKASFGAPGVGRVPPTLVKQYWEEMVIDYIEGNQVFLTENLKYDHKGGRNDAGELEFLPHIGVLDRNVVVRSENPSGTRGHVAFLDRADIDIRYSRFSDLGRTDAFLTLDNTAYQNNILLKIGTNQVGRYAVHFHHLSGPVNPTNTGYQLKFIGNTVDRAKKWNVTVHGTDYGLFTDNVIYDGQGGGFVTEDGNEIGSDFLRNFIVRMQGTFVDGKTFDGTDFSRGGNGFWFRRSGNNVIGNVVADTTYSNYYYSSYYLHTAVPVRNFRGADLKTQSTPTLTNPAGIFEDNEGYGMSVHGMWTAYPTGNKANTEPFLVKNYRAWHVMGGVKAYHIRDVTFDDVTILFDVKASNRRDFGAIGFIFTTYESDRLTVKNSRVEGGYIGVYAPSMDMSDLYMDRPTILENLVLKNLKNIIYHPPLGFANSLIVRNVRFSNRSNWTGGSACCNYPDLTPRDIEMRESHERTTIYSRSTVRVYDYNGVAGDDFQVFYPYQSGGYILPKTGPSVLTVTHPNEVIGSPEAGLTNEQNWAKYKIAMGGGITPCLDDTSRPNIRGYTCPIQPLRPGPPELVVTVPWPHLTVSYTNPVPVYYTVHGFIPQGAKAFFSVNNRPGFAIEGGNTALYPYRFLNSDPEGAHELRAWIGDAVTMEPLPGTVTKCVPFAVSVTTPPTQYETQGLCPENAGN